MLRSHVRYRFRNLTFSCPLGIRTAGWGSSHTGLSVTGLGWAFVQGEPQAVCRSWPSYMARLGLELHESNRWASESSIVTKNDKDGQTWEKHIWQKTWNLEMSSICLALATSFSQGLFSIRRRVIWAIWLVYIYMTCSMCPPVKINQKSIHDSAKWKFTIQTFTWLLGYAFLHVFFAANISCVEFSFTWLSSYFGFILVLGAIFEAIYWHSFP